MTEERTSTLERVDPFYLPIFLYKDAITDEQCDALRQYADAIEDWGSCIEGNDNAMHLCYDKDVMSHMSDMKFHFEALMQDISTQVMRQITEGFAIRSSWFTRTRKGEVSTMHNHKNYYMSGVLYLQDDNRLVIQNPHFEKTHFVFGVQDQSPYTCFSTMIYAPKNSLLIMPAYMFHQVPTWDKDDEVRYSLAMNFHPIGHYGIDASSITVK